MREHSGQGGVHYGKKYMRKWLDSYDGKKFFVLKMDVHHFFESINRRILKRKLKEVIRDKRFYRLLCILIEHDKIALVAKILTDAGVEIDAEQTKTLVGCIAFDDISGALEILQEIGRCLDLNIRYLIKAGIRYSIKTESRSQRVVCLILWDFNFTMTGQPSGNQTLRLRDARQTISQSRIKSHGITHR